MAAYTQIGQNLYADNAGKYYNYDNNAYTNVESPFDTMSNKINSMYDAQKTNQLDLLKQQREKAITGFNQQKKDLAPQYQNQRNQADVVNAQNVSRLRELMAANGINASGESLTTQANLASSRQSALGDINNNEAYAVRQIDDQIANENDPAREQAIINAIEAERSGKLADAWQQAQQQQYQQEVDWRNWQMQQQQWELEKKLKEIEIQKALAAGKGGSGGGGGRKSSSKTSSTSSSTAAPASMEQDLAAYYQNKFENYMAPRPWSAAEGMKGPRPIF